MPIFNLSKNNRPTFSLGDDGLVDFLKAGGGQKYVSATKALQNSDFFSLIMQVSGDLATTKLTADTDRTQNLLDNPTTTTNAYSFWQGMFAQLLIDGNAYAFRHRNINGVDLWWEYLRPSQVEPMLLEDGTGLVYNINFDEPGVGFVANVPAPDVIHFRLLSQNGGKTGMSPLSALVNEFEIKDSSNATTLKALKQSIVANAVVQVQHGGLLDAKQRLARSRQLARQMNSSEGPVVLDQLETFTPLEVKSNVANLLSQVDWTGSQIAKVYGIPDSYLNGKGDQQSSVTQIGGMYAKSLNRYANAIVGELNNKLNARIEADIRPATDALGDQYATTISSLAKDGTIASNQARFILQQSGYLPDDLPTADKVIPQTEGGEDDDEED